MSTKSSQNQDYIRNHLSEGMDALEKESKLPLKGWENEIARAKEYGLEAAKSIVESVHKSYLDNFKLGPPNRLEHRIIHWQKIYKDFLDKSGISL